MSSVSKIYNLVTNERSAIFECFNSFFRLRNKGDGSEPFNSVLSWLFACVKYTLQCSRAKACTRCETDQLSRVPLSSPALLGWEKPVLCPQSRSRGLFPAMLPEPSRRAQLHLCAAAGLGITATHWAGREKQSPGSLHHLSLVGDIAPHSCCHPSLLPPSFTCQAAAWTTMSLSHIGLS